MLASPSGILASALSSDRVSSACKSLDEPNRARCSGIMNIIWLPVERFAILKHSSSPMSSETGGDNNESPPPTQNMTIMDDQGGCLSPGRTTQEETSNVKTKEECLGR
ncbi:hypothetical protein B0T09DRAFT_323101 [Sordaria sp. MPI-SDFR-AT-0083]|nr:hypothetical protein B0T09DRAFT_323101 [Sordaria sp. MPI-SDFR-AT-0083]